MITKITRATKFALQNLGRNWVLSFVTIFVLVLTLFSLSVVFSLSFLGNQIVSALEEKIDINIYFSNSIPESKVLAAQQYLLGLDNVEMVEYVTSEQALEEFKRNNADNEALQEALEEVSGDNPLPAHLSVKSGDINAYSAIMEKFEASEFNDLVSEKDFTDHRLIIDKIHTISRRVGQFGIGVSLIFMLISGLVIFNTIKLTI